MRSRCLFFHNSVRHDSLIATAGLTVAAIGYGGNLALRSLERYRHEHNENPLNSGNANHDQVSKDDLDAEHSDPESVRASSESGEGPRAEERPKDGNPRAFERPPISEQTNLEDAFKHLTTTLSNLQFRMPSASDITGAAAGARYYGGGFSEKMSRREAAQILGVRESADAKRIKDAHRRILMANHPDKGGSPFMAAKINEAKELLLRGRAKTVL